MKKNLRLGVFVAFLCTFSVVSVADTVNLKNGDRLSGRLVKLGEEKLVIETDYAGEVRVNLEKVISVETDEAVSFRSKSGGLYRAKLDKSSDGKVLAGGKIWALDELQFDPALETMNPASQDTFHGRAEASTENLQNKTRTRYAEIDLNLTWQKQAWRHTVDVKKRNDSEAGEKTEDSQKLEYSVDYFLSPEWFARGNSFYQRDRVTVGSDLHYNGLGLGKKLWKNENASWEVIATYNRLIIGSRPFQIDLNTWLLSTEFKRKFENEKWDVYAKADVLFPQHVPVKLIMQSEAGLRYQLNTQIYLTAKLMLDLIGSSGGNLKSHSYKLGIGTKW
ncbi:MAG: DUF481 domain-containing protein [Burkholderiaceae bacterium]|nr:MAG: DUF481 domain-containing protein [Burkholderiaceae bacterium]